MPKASRNSREIARAWQLIRTQINFNSQTWGENVCGVWSRCDRAPPTSSYSQAGLSSLDRARRRGILRSVCQMYASRLYAAVAPSGRQVQVPCHRSDFYKSGMNFEGPRHDHWIVLKSALAKTVNCSWTRTGLSKCAQTKRRTSNIPRALSNHDASHYPTLTSKAVWRELISRRSFGTVGPRYPR